MSTDAITSLAQTGWEPNPNRRRFTRQECRFLEENGLLPNRYELIDGEIMITMSQNRPHILVIMLLTRWLFQVFGAEFVQMQGPIDVAADDNEINRPEPDGLVVSHPIQTFMLSNPAPPDILLTIEVSDTTLRTDLNNKALLYARAEIREYWVVDIEGRRIIVHRSPAPEGYQTVVSYSEEERITSLAQPAASLAISELLPPV